MGSNRRRASSSHKSQAGSLLAGWGIPGLWRQVASAGVPDGGLGLRVGARYQEKQEHQFLLLPSDFLLHLLQINSLFDRILVDSIIRCFGHKILHHSPSKSHPNRTEKLFTFSLEHKFVRQTGQMWKRQCIFMKRAFQKAV